MHEFCATLIQATWRGYISMEKYIISILRVITVQSVARRWIARRVTNRLIELRHLMEIESATVIQLGWRTYQKRRAMSTMRRLAQVEAAAATRIESSWKRIVQQSKYRLAVASTYRKYIR